MIIYMCIYIYIHIHITYTYNVYITKNLIEFVGVHAKCKHQRYWVFDFPEAADRTRHSVQKNLRFSWQWPVLSKSISIQWWLFVSIIPWLFLKIPFVRHHFSDMFCSQNAGIVDGTPVCRHTAIFIDDFPAYPIGSIVIDGPIWTRFLENLLCPPGFFHSTAGRCFLGSRRDHWMTWVASCFTPTGFTEHIKVFSHQTSGITWLFFKTYASCVIKHQWIS